MTPKDVLYEFASRAFDSGLATDEEIRLLVGYKHTNNKIAQRRYYRVLNALKRPHKPKPKPFLAGWD